MGLITNLIGNYGRAKEEEQRQKTAQIQQQLGLYQAIMTSPDMTPQAKQAAATNITGLLTKHGGPEAKKHGGFFGTMLGTLAGVGSGMAGVPRQQAAPTPVTAMPEQMLMTEEQKAAQEEQKAIGAEKRKLTTAAMERAERRKEGEAKGLKGDALNAFELTGRLPSGYAEEPGQRKLITLQTPDGKSLRVKEGANGRFYNVAGQDVTDKLPPGTTYADESKVTARTPFTVRNKETGATTTIWKDAHGFTYDLGGNQIAIDPEVYEVVGKTGTATATQDKDARLLTDRLIKSGQITDPKEAEQKANDILANIQKNKQGAAGGAQMTQPELHALAKYDLLMGKTTAFGRANDPNRAAYQAERARILMAEGPRSVAEEGASQKADTTSLASLVKMTDAVDAWENNAKRNMDQVLKTGQAVGRSGSSLANEYQQYLQGKLEDYPELAKFRVAVETAAAEYTKVMYSPTASGGTAKDQREASHGMLNTAMAEGTLEGAIEQMMIDMDNRHNTLHEQIGNVQQRMRGGEGKGGGGGAAGGVPKKGDQKSYQGADYVFDGTQWVRK